MKKILSLLTILFTAPLALLAADQTSMLDKFDNFIGEYIVAPAAEYFFFWEPFGHGLPLVVIWLVVGALFFTIFMKFINFSGFMHAIQLVRGKYDKPDEVGEVSHFQALVTALSATVGLGNIASVAIAVSIGGPGATFWMIVAGLLGMTSKFVECTLGVKFRKINADGSVSGGPMYYLSRGLKYLKLKKTDPDIQISEVDDKPAKGALVVLGKILAVVFAILCVGGSLGGGNMFQANQAVDQMVDVFGMSESVKLYLGIGMALLVGVVIIGGIKSIAKVTDKIVPFMCGMYVLTALIIIGMNITEVGDAFMAIINGAFSPHALYGGIAGVIVQGFKRAAFSNEAGVGSAAIAHSAVKTDKPVTEGYVGLLEPFIDTVIICTMTALVLIFTGFADRTGDRYVENIKTELHMEQAVVIQDQNVKTLAQFKESGQIANLKEGDDVIILYEEKGAHVYSYKTGVEGEDADGFVEIDKLEGARLTSMSFSSVFPWFRYVLLVAIVLFAFSTMISWSYYGLKAWTFMFGESRGADVSFKLLFLIFVVIGSVIKLGNVLDFSDFMILGMAFPNILGLYFLAPLVKKELTEYKAKLKSGEIKKYK